MEIEFMVTSFIYGELGTVTKTRKTELEKNEDFVKKSYIFQPTETLVDACILRLAR